MPSILRQAALQLNVKMSQSLLLFAPQLPLEAAAAHTGLHAGHQGGVLAEHQAEPGVLLDGIALHPGAGPAGDVGALRQPHPARGQ